MADELVDRFNKLWLHTQLSGREIVLGRDRLDVLRRSTFVNLYSHEEGNPGLQWLKHPEHAVARAGIVFDHTKPKGLVDIGNPAGQAFNIYGYPGEAIDRIRRLSRYTRR